MYRTKASDWNVIIARCVCGVSPGQGVMADTEMPRMTRVPPAVNAKCLCDGPTDRVASVLARLSFFLAVGHNV